MDPEERASEEVARAEEPGKPTAEPNGEEDWKAKYEKAISYSRDWEKKAKANKEAAEKLAAMEQERQTDSEKIADLANRLDEKERAEKRAKLVAKVAAEKGVPADLIAGDDEESMAAWADRLKTAMTPPRLAKVRKPGTFDRGGDGNDDPMRSVVKQLFKNE